MMPGTVAGDPLYGLSPPLFDDDADDGAVVEPLPLDTTIWSKLYPPVSDMIVSCCTPAPSVAVKLTVVQVCQPPVFGTLTCCHTLLALLNPTCILVPLLGDATRIVIV